MSGPQSAFQPTLPSEFVDLARRLARRRTAPHRLWQRVKLVLLLHDHQALSTVAAGQQIGLSDQTVRAWRRRWAGGE